MAFIYVQFRRGYYFQIHRLLFIKTNPQLELGNAETGTNDLGGARVVAGGKRQQRQDILLW